MKAHNTITKRDVRNILLFLGSIILILSLTAFVTYKVTGSFKSLVEKPKKEIKAKYHKKVGSKIRKAIPIF